VGYITFKMKNFC